MVQLNISDVAVLLGRVESTAAGNSEALRPDEVAVRRVSRKLNNALQTFQQDRCRTPGVDFTDTGAWCQSTVDQCHITDRSLADTLGHFLAGSTVLSLGDGTGVYRSRGEMPVRTRPVSTVPVVQLVQSQGMLFTTKHVMYQVKVCFRDLLVCWHFPVPSVHVYVNSQYTSRE